MNRHPNAKTNLHSWICNSFVPEVTIPKLSIVDQPGFEIVATSILFDEINSKKRNEPIIFQSIELETSIPEREST